MDNISNNKTYGHVNIGMKAPDFHATTTFGNIKLSDFKGKWVVLFSHPGDFTPVTNRLNNNIIKNRTTQTATS